MDETQDQEHFIRGLQAGSGLITEGDPYPGRGMFNVGQSLELDSLATFVDSIPMPRNPDIPLGGPIPPEVERGLLVFESPATQCAVCHPAPFYTDRQKHDVGTANVEATLVFRRAFKELMEAKRWDDTPDITMEQETDSVVIP